MPAPTNRRRMNHVVALWRQTIRFGRFVVPIQDDAWSRLARLRFKSSGDECHRRSLSWNAVSPGARLCRNKRNGRDKPGHDKHTDDRRGARLAANGRGLSPGPADRSHLSAVSASAEELIAAIGFEPRHTRSTWHLEPFQNLSGSRIDAPHIALVTFPGAVPELAVDPGDPGDDAVRLDGAKDRARLGIDLVDLAVPMLAHPERPFGPRQPRVTAAAGRRDRGHHTAGLRVDFLDAILGDLKQVLAVEGGSRMRGDIDRAHHRSARRIEGVQPVSGRKPDVPTVKRDPMDLVGIRKGSILAEDFGCRSFHASILVTGQWTGE